MATRKTELSEIKRFGGTPTKNSGRGQIQKGDAILFPFTVDVKEYRTSFSVSRENWAKICTDAARNGNEPSLMLAIGEGEATVRVWVVADEMFKQMLMAWREKHE